MLDFQSLGLRPSLSAVNILSARYPGLKGVKARAPVDSTIGPDGAIDVPDVMSS